MNEAAQAENAKKTVMRMLRLADGYRIKYELSINYGTDAVRSLVGRVHFYTSIMNSYTAILTIFHQR